jgi:hypothetical protein
MTGNAPDQMDDRAADGPPGVPPWVKLLGVGALVVVIVLVLAMLLVGGEHGPGMHGG